MDTTTQEEHTELKRQCAELAGLLDGGWTRGQKDRCSLYHVAAMSDSVPVMRAALARWNAYTANTRRAYLATARRARERRDLARQPGASNHRRSAEPIPFPQRPARTLMDHLRESPRLWPERYTVVTATAAESRTSAHNRTGMETMVRMGERYGVAVAVTPLHARPVADLAAYRAAKGIIE